MATDYAPPLDQFLTLGEPEPGRAVDWPNYVQEFGLEPEDIPELIRLATDADLHTEDTTSPSVWAPVHAWRALGQLRAEAAVEPLLRLLDDEDDDWGAEELPKVFTLIGPAALPPLIAYLTDPERPVWGRSRTVGGLETIATQYPETRDDVIAAIRRQLEAFQDTDPVLNGYLIDLLLQFKVADALPLIEQVFAADRVDPLFIGREDMQEAFGMITPEEAVRVRRARRAALLGLDAVPSTPEGAGAPLSGAGATHRAQATKAKAKRKLAKASRQKNRKRK
jgi:HEAT repeat protein